MNGHIMTHTDGYYLIEFDKDKIYQWDGYHSSKKGVLEALELWKKLGFIRSDRKYAIIKKTSVKEKF